MNQSSALRLFATTAVSFALTVPAAYADSQPVRVTNTNTNPVPVNGNVVVSGTANVNVTNPVTIGNTTPIPVAVTGPISIPMVDNPARSAFDDESLMYAKDLISGHITFLKPIPPGTRFAIEQANISCQSTQGSYPVSASLLIRRGGSQLGRTAVYAFPLQYQGTFLGALGSQDMHVGIIPSGIYIDSVDTYGADFLRAQSSGDTACYVSVTGHLVTL